MKLAIFLSFVTALSSPLAFSQTTDPPKPTPDQIEAVKQHNEKANQMNAIITRYNAAVDKKDWSAAAEDVKQLITLDPKPDYYVTLGNAQLYSGKCDDAIGTYKTLLKLVGYPADLKAANAKTRTLAGVALTSIGNAFIKLKNYAEATRNYENAAEIDPNPGLAYFNLCATQYNIGNMDKAISACGKSITADPTRADAYFIKGSALFGNGRIDASGKYIPPPGTIEALKKYLELAPNGGHAADVKAMLDYSK